VPTVSEGLILVTDNQTDNVRHEAPFPPWGDG